MTQLSTYILHVIKIGAMVLLFDKSTENMRQGIYYNEKLDFPGFVVPKLFEGAIEESLEHFCTECELKMFANQKYQF